MKINILTLFPKMFDGFKSESIIKRAIDENKVSIDLCDFRKYSKNKHNKVDDTPYGGGGGMVLMCQPIFDAVNDIKTEKSKVILLSPQGEKFTQEKAYELAKEEDLIFICGHYEGFDERIKTICDEEISIGDYVLTGGELASMVITDAVVRLLPGVIEEESHLKESFNNNLLDYPTYTKPKVFNGLEVPEVLLSGDHKKIDEWRYNEQLKITEEKRPDLLSRKIKLNKKGIKKKKNKIDLDDIKDIKVTTIKEIKKTGIYKITRQEETKALTIFNPKKLSGYKLRGKNKDNNVNRILILKNEFIAKVAMKNVIKKVDVLSYRFNIALQDEDDESTGRVLGEAEMLKSMIISAYARYLGNENLDKIIKSINYLVNEFVKKKSLQNTYSNNIKQESRRR